MPLHLQTPFDRRSDPERDWSAHAEDRDYAEREAELLELYRPKPPQQQRHTRRVFADLTYIVLRALAFLGSTYLAVLGLPLVFFLLLSGGDPAQFYAQLGNISVHYLAADPVARAEFDQLVCYGLLAIATLVVIWRLPRFVVQVADALGETPSSPERAL